MWLKLLLVLIPLMLLAAMACTPEQAKLLEGVLQEADAVDGQITIVTKEGKTVTLTIATEAVVETEDGTSAALEALEPGNRVTVEVSDDDQVAQRIQARQARAEGVIVQIDGNDVTLETEGDRRVTVVVTEETRIKLDDGVPGTLADLRNGVEVEVKFDPESGGAFKLSLEEEKAEIEGSLVAVGDDEVTIETQRGRSLALVVGPGTHIELDEDFAGTLADLREGMQVEAKFDPLSRRALKIEVEDQEAEIKGRIVSVEDQEVTIESEGGHQRTLTVADQTRVKLKEDDFPGRVSDLREGVRVEAKFDPHTTVAMTIEVKD